MLLARRRLNRLVLFALVLFQPVFVFGQGGPPLITDDPDTPGNRNWEINIANIGQFSSSQKSVQSPYFDINYGLGERIQLKLETGWDFVKDRDLGLKSGQASVLAGVKWRFLDEEASGISVSTYPQFNFHPFFSSEDPEIAEPGNQTLLPIEASKHFGRWALDSEVGYTFSDQSANQFFYGGIVAYELKKESLLLLEIHGNTAADGTGSDLLFNVGTSYALGESMSLLFSVGHTIETREDDESQLLSYLGVQLRL